MRNVFQITTIGLAFLWFIGVESAVAQTSGNLEEPRTLDLTLREAIHNVAEVISVLPIDLYEGATQIEYEDWDSRYDFTYREFRPNYALYLIARNASKQESLESFNDFSKLSAKEKILTCAALIAYLQANAYWKGCEKQSPSTADSLRQPDFSPEEREKILQTLQGALKDNGVGFFKVKNDELSGAWEENLRQEAYYFARLHRAFGGTELFSALDLLVFPKPERYEAARRTFYRFDTWNNDTCQLPIEFLCSLMLLNASYDREQLRDVARISEDDQSVETLKKLERLERDLVVERFMLGQRSISEVEYERLAPKNAEERKQWREKSYFPFIKTNPMAEGAIMRAYLRTQFISSRLGKRDDLNAIHGNSSQKDVVVSEMAQKALDWLDGSLGTSASNSVAKANESNSEKISSKNSSDLRLLDLVRNNANSVEYFSLSLFLNLYKLGDLNDDIDFHRLALEKACYPISFERFCKSEFLFEAALHASRDEIDGCLNSVSELSPKEKAFVLLSCLSYVLRMTDSNGLTSEELKAEPLTAEEKNLLLLFVQDCMKDDSIVFTALESTREEWEKSFRKGALEFQKSIGDNNPFYPYSSGTAEMWQSVCNEAPIAFLYSILISEVCLDPCSMLLSTQSEEWSSMDLNSLKTIQLANYDDNIRREIIIMKRFLFLNTCIGQRDPNDGNRSSRPKPVGVEKISELRMRDAATQVMDILKKLL